MYIAGSQHWRAPDTSAQGPKPESRMGHTAVYDPTVRCIYVFGGSKNKRWFNDVHVLDVDNWKWQAVKASLTLRHLQLICDSLIHRVATVNMCCLVEIPPLLLISR